MQNQTVADQKNNKKTIQEIYDDCKQKHLARYKEIIEYFLDIREKVLDEKYQWNDEEELVKLLDKHNLIANAEHWPTDNLRLYWKSNLNIIRDILKENLSITHETYCNLMQAFKLRRRSQRFNRLICTLFPGQLLFIPAYSKLSDIKIPGLTDTDNFSKQSWWIDKNISLFKYCYEKIEDFDKNKSFYISCFAWYWRDYLIKNGQAELSDSNTNLKINFPLQRIIFGAPGTGKSFKLKEDAKNFEKQSKTQIPPIESSNVDYSNELLKDLQYTSNNKVAYHTSLGLKYQDFIETYTGDADNKKNKLCELLNDIANKDNIADRLLNGYNIAKFIDRASDNTSNNQFVERVTFHPNYSYAQFVGTYKPVTKKIDEKEEIAYKYVPGPFMRIYAAAKRNPSQNFLLIIEEINRANVAAVFGDVFQLLDRDESGNSEFPIAASEDIQKYLEQAGIFETELSIPSNMYIWATMNSADQGVMPIDAAFKRRWNFEYIGIDDNEKWQYEIPIPQDDTIDWNTLRKAINDKLKQIPGVNEDKLLGPYFISKNTLESLKTANEADEEKFIETFKSKVLMYLFEDVVKMRPKELFAGIKEEQRLHFSDICKAFDEKGIGIFNFDKDDLNSKYHPESEQDTQQAEQ